MQISSRFTIAIHMLTAMEHFQNETKITSDFLASSVNTNPVIVRKIMQQLKATELIEVKRGQGGMQVRKPLEEITLYDVFRAVEPLEEEKLFHFHENPNTECPVGRNMHAGLDDKLERIQNAMEREMKSITIADVVADVEHQIMKENMISAIL